MTKFLQASDRKFTTLPELYAKYGLSICWLSCWPLWTLEDGDTIPSHGFDKGFYDEYIENANLAIQYHWFVCRYLEGHPGVAERYHTREVGWRYYDILNLAEEEYAQDLR